MAYQSAAHWAKDKASANPGAGSSCSVPSARTRERNRLRASLIFRGNFACQLAIANPALAVQTILSQWNVEHGTSKGRKGLTLGSGYCFTPFA